MNMVSSNYITHPQKDAHPIFPNPYAAQSMLVRSTAFAVSSHRNMCLHDNDLPKLWNACTRRNDMAFKFDVITPYTPTRSVSNTSIYPVTRTGRTRPKSDPRAWLALYFQAKKGEELTPRHDHTGKRHLLRISKFCIRYTLLSTSTA